MNLLHNTGEQLRCISLHYMKKYTMTLIIKHFPLSILFAIALLAGCASEIKSIPVDLELTPPDQTFETITFNNAVTIKLPTGYTREIRSGSHWVLIGTIPQGKVYKPLDYIFTVEGANIREAYIVIYQSRLTGFYLPGENSFYELPKDVALPMK